MLYELNRDNIELSKPVQIRTPKDVRLTERDIENFLESRLSEIVSGDALMLIGQERAGQEEADLLALDEEGILYIFELKRWESNKENILQVMRYGQIFGRYPYEELERLARRQQKLEGSLKEKHQKYFALDNPLEESKFNHDQVFVLVTNGMDKDTISAVEFWAQKGVRIECSPYRIYEIGSTPYIQFDTYNPNDEIFAEGNMNYFIVNTNKTYMPDAWMDMLNNRLTGKASAYYDRKHSICRIPRDSSVYLYHTGVGVIAKGVATADSQMADYQGDENAEFYVPLNFSWTLDEDEWSRRAPKAWQINRRMNSSYRFRQTVFSVTQDMAEAIDFIFQENQNNAE